ncbi:UNVERIFIED_CONTAM: hypothetical protein FKN15_024346 [Acipenser sinensis]
MAVRQCGLVRSLLLSVLLLLSVSPDISNGSASSKSFPVTFSVTCRATRSIEITMYCTYLLLARDPDNDPLVFGVVGEEATRYFAVESSTGVVWLRQPLDREMKSEFQVEFSVSDNQGVIKGTVNIQVGDVNDNAPTFHSQPYSVRIPENTPVATPIFIVNATDPDQGTGGSVLFSFQPPSPFFAIDGARGVVTVIRLLDYETTQGYQLTVNATDQDKTRPLSTLVNLAITITDVQDMDPVFINLPYSTNIYENSPPGSTVRMITAIDQDRGKPRGIGYTIVSGNTNNIFALDYISGALTLNGQLDRENPLYSSGFLLTVRGTELNDDRTPSIAMVTTSFNILVIDVNDNAPQFNSSEYRLRITELAQVGFALPLFIQVQDLDEGPNSMFQVFLTGNNSDHFIISPTSVQGRADIRIRVAEPLDFESVSSYRFSLLANETASEHAGFARVQIDLINENDNRPIFTKSLYNASLFENATVGTAVLQVLATDGDFGSFGAVSYFFSDEPDKFSIDKDSGQVTLMGRLDFELAQRYTLTVIARDGGGEETTGRLRVNVLDVNDNTPTFQKEGYLGSVRENEPTTVQVTRLRCVMTPIKLTHLSITETINILQKLPQGRQALTFSPVCLPGEITTTSLLDREQKSEYILIVRAVDGGVGPTQKTGIATWRITRTVPYRALPGRMCQWRTTRTRTLPYRALTGRMCQWRTTRTVLSPHGSDVPVENHLYPYRTEPSRVGCASGEVVLETKRTIACASEALLCRNRVNITLLDINDNPPAWRDEPYQVNVVEMSPIDTDVVTVLAVDPDRAENGSVVYSINPSNRFYMINSTSGKIRTTGAVLDRESRTAGELELMRRIVVSARDRGTPPLYATASTTVQVNLLDLNDNDPAFQNLPFVAEVPEGLPIGSSVYQVGMPRMDFVINGSTGLVTSTVVLDREHTAEYYLRVVARDAGQFPRSSTSTLTDVNDNRPIFLQNSYETSVLETIPESTSIVQVQATDADEGENGRVLYRILSGNANSMFRIQSGTGLISRGQLPLNREASASHMLEVEAYNSDLGSMRSTVRVIVYVEDANDEAPVFTQQQYNRLGLRETAGIGTSVIVVRATDRDTGDGGAVAYSIVSGADGKFEIDVSTGLVTTLDYLDYETKTSYLMNVSATDQAPPFHRGFCSVYVTLLNELDEAVAFSSPTYETELPENIATGTEVVQVQARSADNLNQITYRFDPDTVSITILDENDNSPEFDITSDSSVDVREDTPPGRRVAVVLGRDRDAGRNGLVNFTLVAGNVREAFEIRTINNTYGEVYIVRPLDREAIDRYLLTVRATDNGSPPRRTDSGLTINVLDVNDNPPVIQNPGGYNVSINENVGGGTAVMRVQATDRDIGSNGMLSYYITQGNEDLTFRMDRVTGEVVTRPSPPDRERQQFYQLSVTVEDDGTPVLSVRRQILH